MTTNAAATPTKTKAARVVLLTLAMGQFLMTLDTSVMNVSIATVAKDTGTIVTGIQALAQPRAVQLRADRRAVAREIASPQRSWRPVRRRPARVLGGFSGPSG